MTTVLTLIQDFTDKMTLPTPAALIGVNEKGVRQIRSLLREVIADLSEYRWTEQRLRVTWTALAAQNQGPLTTIFGAGYMGLVPNTLWCVSRKIPIYGPVTDAVWNAYQNLPSVGPEFQFWLSGGNLYISPALAVTDTLSAIYITKYAVLAVDGVTAKERITVDDDSLLFPDNVVLRALEYKWRKQKGEAGWEDDYNAYIALVSKNLVKDGMPTFRVDQRTPGVRPGIIIPSGSWNV